VARVTRKAFLRRKVLLLLVLYAFSVKRKLIFSTFPNNNYLSESY
jgi:hypothetical protein